MNDDSVSPTPPVLGADDPPPFERLNENGAAPLLLTCDHASRRIPAGLDGLGLSPGVLDQHVAWDIGAAEVTRRLSATLDAAAVLAGYSRLVVDCNRPPGDPSAMPAVSDGIEIPGNKGLREADQMARTEAVFWPYHHAVAEAVAHLWRTGTPPAVVSIHSFTPTMDGADRPWQVGILWNRDPRMAEPVIHELRRRPEGLTVGDNEPYSGKDLYYSLDTAAGAAGLPHCAFEIRQDLIADDAGAEAWTAILADVISAVLAIDDLHAVMHY